VLFSFVGAVIMHRALVITSACLSTVSSKDLPFSQDTALKYAQLSVAAYCGYPQSPTELVESWQCGPACDAVPGMKSVRVVQTPENDDAFAFVGKLEDQCVLSFRGTTNFAGWVLDIESGDDANLNDFGIDCSFDGKPCRAGRGWVKNYQNIAGHILGNLSDIGCKPGSSITITGHSLGAAQAGVAMIDLNNKGYTIDQSYTFGQPRIGNKAFVSAFEAAFGTQRVMRVTHYYDPVPHLPPSALGFSHVPQEVYYERQTSDGYHVCDASGEDKSCADQWYDVPLMIADCLSKGDKCDHLTYLQGILPYKLDGVSCAQSSTATVSV